MADVPLEKVNICCGEMEYRLKNSEMFCLMDRPPFNPKHEETFPTIFILSDGGHGGWCAIKFCPFCGHKWENEFRLVKPDIRSRIKDLSQW